MLFCSATELSTTRAALGITLSATNQSLLVRLLITLEHRTRAFPAAQLAYNLQRLVQVIGREGTAK